MSGRPKPAYAWASEANYPAGANPWDGLAVRVAPGSDYWYPGNPVPAQYMNYVQGRAADDIAALQLFAGQNPALNWRAPVLAPSGMNNWQAITKDEANGRWLAMAFQAATPEFQMYASTDGGLTWGTAGNTYTWSSGSGHVSSMLQDPNLPQRCFAVVYTASFGAQILRLDTRFSTAWTLCVGLTSTALEAQLIYFSPLGFVSLSGGTGSSAQIYTSADGTTWTSRTVPAALAAAPSFSVATNNSKLIAVANATGQTNIMSSTDGITWTTSTIPIGANETPMGIAFGQFYEQPAWVIATQNTVSGQSAFYLSQDNGSSWLQVATVTALVTDLVGFGSMFVAITESNRLARVLFSIDGGGSWHYAQTGFSDNAAPGADPYRRPRLAVSATGFAACNAKFVGVSFESGMPVNAS